MFVNIDYQSFFFGVAVTLIIAAPVALVWRNFRHRCVCGGKTNKKVRHHRLNELRECVRVRVYSFRICQDCGLVSVGGGVKAYSYKRAAELDYNTAEITELCRRAGVSGIIDTTVGQKR